MFARRCVSKNMENSTARTTAEAAGEPSSYRPLCMIDTMGKILERLICVRLKNQLEKETCSLFENQWLTIKKLTEITGKAVEGDRRMYGKKLYCAVITFDVKNAFNSVSWPHILQALETKRTPACLLNIRATYLKGC